MNDLVSRQAILALPRNKVRSLRTYEVIEETINVTDIEHIPPAQPTNIQDILEYIDTVLHPIISPDHWNVYSELHDMISALPPTQPEPANSLTKSDMISKQKVRYKLTALVNEIEEIFANIREREVDDSVCGLCEYDGACNECPGFEKDNCFKLKDKYRAEWESMDE